jgi:uncharacterized membrane protein YeaQ/YmgE (transglycosylase-associated protein family)
MSRLYLVLALAVGAVIGAVACLPKPRADLRTAGKSIALGLVGALFGWQMSVVLGANEVGPLAQLFFSVLGAGTLVSIYHVATSERPPLR